MNFSYLKNVELPKGLYEACREAELFAKTFPMASLSSSRRAGEFTVRMMYSYLVGEQYICDKTTFEILKELEYTTRLNDIRWFASAHKVRKSGNDASHQGEGDVQIALNVLTALYYEIGFALKYIGLISSYSPFDLSLVPATTDEPVPKSNIEIELTKEFLEKIHTSNIRNNSYIKTPIDIQKSTVKDSGVNSKTALKDVTNYIADKKPEWNVQNDLIQGKVFITSLIGKTVTVAVKSGCPPLGKRVRGVMELLPGIDYVAYAPSFSTDKTYVEQLRIFTKEDFLSMWNKLGLIRAKVSTATYNRLKEELPPGAVINKEEYADTIAVQSFSNSGKKTRLLNEELEKKPLLSQEGLQILERALS